MRKARVTYPALDSLLPLQLKIEAEMKRSRNSVEGQLRFSHSTKDIQARVYDSQTQVDKVNAAASLAARIAKKLAAENQLKVQYKQNLLQNQQMFATSKNKFLFD